MTGTCWNCKNKGCELCETQDCPCKVCSEGPDALYNAGLDTHSCVWHCKYDGKRPKWFNETHEALLDKIERIKEEQEAENRRLEQELEEYESTDGGEGNEGDVSE